MNLSFKAELKWLWQRVKNVRHFFRSLFWVSYYGYPAKQFVVIGVTGTDGKTTTSTLLYEILKANGLRAGLITTVGTKYVESPINNTQPAQEIIIETGLHTTNPEARELQPILKRMKEGGVTHLVLEVTAHGLDQHRVMGSNIQIGVVTNISHEHLDDFVTMERYARAKLKLASSVKYLVLNKDDEWYEFFKSHIAKDGSKTIIPYVKTDIPDEHIPDSLKGEYNKYNIAAATAVAGILKVPHSMVVKAVSEFRGIEGRREEVVNSRGFRVFVDFAHTPTGLRGVLTQLRDETEGRLIAVFGCTGERDNTKRPMMGKVASELADTVIVTSDDTRHEDQDHIAQQIILGISNHEEKIKDKSLWIENDRRRAIQTAFKLAQAGDTVLLAGKGHEKSINLGGVEHPWSDADVAKEELGD